MTNPISNLYERAPEAFETHSITYYQSSCIAIDGEEVIRKLYSKYNAPHGQVLEFIEKQSSYFQRLMDMILPMIKSHIQIVWIFDPEKPQKQDDLEEQQSQSETQFQVTASSANHESDISCDLEAKIKNSLVHDTIRMLRLIGINAYHSLVHASHIQCIRVCKKGLTDSVGVVDDEYSLLTQGVPVLITQLQNIHKQQQVVQINREKLLQIIDQSYLLKDQTHLDYASDWIESSIPNYDKNHDYEELQHFLIVQKDLNSQYVLNFINLLQTGSNIKPQKSLKTFFMCLNDAAPK